MACGVSRERDDAVFPDVRHRARSVAECDGRCLRRPGSGADSAGSAVMDDPVIPYRLYGSDFRALSCRVDPDSRYVGCEKIRVIVDGRSSYLCPPRVYAFLGKGGSLAGLTCVPQSVPERRDG